jgi:integrase
MSRHSDTDNVKKICPCGRKKWSTCAHPWYIDFQAPSDHARLASVRYRPNLDKLIKRHPADFTEAKAEARRAIEAWLEGQSAADVLATDLPTMATVLEAYRDRPNANPIDPSQIRVLARVELRGPDGSRPFGEWRAFDVTTETIDQFRAQRPLVAGNRDLSLLRAMFNWAVLHGLVPSTPFRIGHVTAVKLAREEARTRRLRAGEDERLLLEARGLRDLLTGALETGCRKGELLSLQWHQVRFSPRAELFLPAQKTKAKKDRRIPLSSTLQAVLEARRRDPAGEPLPATAFVFGDAIGRRVRSIKTAWETCVLRSHGHTPDYVKRKLSAASRAALRTIDLHFHDLRREAGSRWMDAGVPLATIQRWLGHANISQTSKYLGASLGADDRDMRAYEERIGRVTSPLTYVDKFSGSNGPQGTRTDQPPLEKTQENPNGPEPVRVVH